MSTIIWALILIGLLGAFFKAELGIVGLMVMAVVLWNFLGGLWENFGKNNNQ